MGLLDIQGLKFSVAEGPVLLREVHRLRYNVYVKEFEFLSPVHHPSGLLADELDGHGVHAIARRGEELIAAIRMVLNSDRGFPILAALPGFKLPAAPERVGEISHLVIDSSFRKRQGDGLYGAESYLKMREGGVLPNDGSLPGALKKRRGPLLILSLLRVLYQTSKRLGVEAWLMLMENKLHVALERHGLPFRQIADPQGGPDGPLPCLLMLSEMESRLHRLDREMMKEFVSGLEKKYAPKF
jgi:N-acyl amino acid synthase of PEP-CTERM/exosortase system